MSLSLVSKASCQYFVNFLSRFVVIFCCCGQAISQIQIFFFSLSSSIKLGLLAIVVFRSLNSKSQTSFPRSFSSTAPHSHRSLYQITSLPISSYSLVQLTAIIISALLCHIKYSLFARTLHPTTTFSIVNIDSDTIAFSSLFSPLLHASLIHLLVDFAINMLLSISFPYMHLSMT